MALNSVFPSSLYRSVRKRFVERSSLKLVDSSFRHLSGPRFQALKDDDVVLVLLGRNVSFAIETFFERNRRLGIKHLLYVDNGSTDDSIDKASRLDNMTVASCSADFRKYQKYIRRLSAQKFHSGGWRLMLDADELFDYPGSDQIDLSQLIRELNARGYTGVVAQMLDMVPPGQLLNHPSQSLEDAIRTHVGYSLEGIESFDYHSQKTKLQFLLAQNRSSNNDIRLLYGGIRSLLFGENCMLTKHPLFKMGPEVSPMPHPHISTGLNCADFSALISHYKFSGGLVERDIRELAENRRRNIDELTRRARAFKDNHNLDFNVPSLQKNPDVTKLLTDGFLAAGPDATSFLRL